MPRHAASFARTGGRLSGTPRTRAATPPAVGSLIPGVLSRLGLGETLERWRAVTEWDAIVGPSLARYVRALRVERDVLVVEATSSAAMDLMTYKKREFLDSLERHLGARMIKDVRFVQMGSPDRP